MIRSKLPSLLFATLLVTHPATAEEVTLQYSGLNLNANLQLADGSTLASDTVLITHGTLAHNGMDIIETLQELLADEGHNSLAINLSLGQSDRHGMYDCTTPHQHTYADAIQEISVWVDWLKSKGSHNIVLMAHSRGGNQTAMFANQTDDVSIKGQVLIAPQTWSQEYVAQDYEKRYHMPLQPILDKAKMLTSHDGNQWMEGIGFIYCAKAKVSADSFIGYYQPDSDLDTPTLLTKAKLPTLVFSGSEDTTVADLDKKMARVTNPNVTAVAIEGADHFFQDLYADEVIERTLEFLETL